MDDAILTPEEKQTVMQFAQQIDLTNSQMILQYGAGTQKKMADFSENALEMYGQKIWGDRGTSDGRCKRTQRILMKKRKKDSLDFSNVPAIK